MSDSTTSARSPLRFAQIAAVAPCPLTSSASTSTPGSGSIGPRSTASPTPPPPGPPARHCAAPAGAGADVNARHAGLEEAIFVVHLNELERRARAVAAALRLVDIRIVELPGKPAGRSEVSSFRRAQLHRELAAAAT